jgi:hypothetical protein
MWARPFAERRYRELEAEGNGDAREQRIDTDLICQTRVDARVEVAQPELNTEGLA